MSTGTALDLSANHEFNGVSFMQGIEETDLLRKACLGDAEARLQLVKEYLNLVVEFAAVYSANTGIPFSQMVQTGTVAVVKAADDFLCSQHVEFGDHVKLHVVKAMEETNHI